MDNPCKDDNYLIFNGTLCRELGYEPCKNYTYMYNNPDECRTKGIEPCEKSEYITLKKEEYAKFDTMKTQNKQRVYPPEQEPFMLPSKIQPSSFLKFSDYNNYMRTMSIKL
jgi:hypothetical protein